MTLVGVASAVGPKTQKRAVVSLTASGAVIAAVTGQRLKVYVYSIQSRSDTMTVQLTDGNGGTNLTHVWSLNAREGVAPPATTPTNFHFATTAGTALWAVITGTGTVDLDVGYWDDDSV